MINWILNIIGMLIYFIQRYAGRRNKTKFSFRFWLNDNWPELITSILFNVALMLLLMQPETNINIDDWLKENIPFQLQIATKPLFSLLLGIGLSALIYKMYRKKTKS
jgi:hypothetical protein